MESVESMTPFGQCCLQGLREVMKKLFRRSPVMQWQIKTKQARVRHQVQVKLHHEQEEVKEGGSL